MIRVAFLLIIAVAAMLASWQLVTTDPGSVHVTWFGWNVDTSALFASLILVVIIAISLPLLRMVMFLMDAPGRIGKASKRARTRRGQEALALGLIAAEAGEFEEARKHANKAEAHTKFQEIAFAYAILSDEARRRRYDATGSVEEAEQEGEFDWKEWFSEMWDGVVSGETIREFKDKYQGMSV